MSSSDDSGNDADGVKYKVGPHEVVLVWSGEDTLGDFEKWGCECEEFNRQTQSVFEDRPECKHVRKAKLAYYHLSNVEEEGEVREVEDSC